MTGRATHDFGTATNMWLTIVLRPATRSPDHLDLQSFRRARLQLRAQNLRGCRFPEEFAIRSKLPSILLPHESRPIHHSRRRQGSSEFELREHPVSCGSMLRPLKQVSRQARAGESRDHATSPARRVLKEEICSHALLHDVRAEDRLADDLVAGWVP